MSTGEGITQEHLEDLKDHHKPLEHQAGADVDEIKMALLERDARVRQLEERLQVTIECVLLL